MADARAPGPLGTGANRPTVDAGTAAVTRMPAPGPTRGSLVSERAAFDNAIQALQAEIANIGVHLVADAEARRVYDRQIRLFADDLRTQVASGQMSWRQAADQAREARNAIMETIRQRSTPVGRAIAQQLKSEGPGLNVLVARKTVQMHGPSANFNALSAAQRNAIYSEIVISAGRSNPRITMAMRNMSRVGRGLVVLSVAISVYEVANAEDKVGAATREAGVTMAGIAGGVVGGAIAGLACGPGAPVCVTIGAFVGGALAAIGVDRQW
jgi:hypothetical protein